MNEKKLTVAFNLDDEKDKRVYEAIARLPELYPEQGLSQAFIAFINDLIIAVSECEERREGCEALLTGLAGGKTWN